MIEGVSGCIILLSFFNNPLCILVLHMLGIVRQAASAAWKRRYEGIIGEGEGFVLYQLDVQRALISGDSDEVRDR